MEVSCRYFPLPLTGQGWVVVLCSLPLTGKGWGWGEDSVLNVFLKNKISLQTLLNKYCLKYTYEVDKIAREYDV